MCDGSAKGNITSHSLNLFQMELDKAVSFEIDVF